MLCVEGGACSITDTWCGPPIFSKLNFFPCARIWLQSNEIAVESEGKISDVARRGRAVGFMIWRLCYRGERSVSVRQGLRTTEKEDDKERQEDDHSRYEMGRLRRCAAK